MRHGNLKDTALAAATAFMAALSALVIYADAAIVRFYERQQDDIRLSRAAPPVPVLNADPAPSPGPSPPPGPARAPLPGDIAGAPFPEYDTGADADYSHQSGELRVAVNKVARGGAAYYVADIWMRNVNCFRTAFSGGKFNGRRESAEKIAGDSGAVLAVNGDFLGGLVIRNGKLYRRARPRPAPSAAPGPGGTAPVPQGRSRPERAVCVLYRDGRLATEEYDGFRSDRAMENGAWQGWQFGPTLIRDGKPMKDVVSRGRSPRCMLGCYGPGHYCVITIDGRQKGYSAGMNFGEMTELALELGLNEAYNLDGGGSAIMVFDGKIINRPSGKKEARRLSDMIVIGEYAGAEGLCPGPSPSAAAGGISDEGR